MSIKTMSVQSRPREHAQAVGVDHISDVELLAIIIASGSHEHSALSLAADILDKSGSLCGLNRINLQTLKLKGLGKVKKITILAAVELGKRAVKQKMGETPVLKTAASLYQFCYPTYFGLMVEKFSLILLDKNYHFVYEDTYESGGMNNIAFSLSWVMKACASNQTPYVILIHNHPSNILYPSSADDITTYSIKESLKLMKIVLLDHLIVGDEGYYSYSEDHRLEKLEELIKKV